MVENKSFREEATQVTMVSIVGNFLLSAFKLFAGLFAHSSAMVSDAIHSASDVFSSIIVIVGVRISSKEADKEHPYGHERMECVAAIILATILLMTGIGIGYFALLKVIHGDYKNLGVPGILALWAAVISIVTKEGMFWYTRYYVKKLDSGALMADAWHHRSDALSSIGSLLGILGARLGYPVMDPIASLVICVFICKASMDIYKDALDKMVDRSCSPEFEEEISDFVRKQDGVLGIDLLHTRLFGNRIYIDIEIEADGELSLRESHAIAENVHDNLEEAYPKIKHIMVHVNPYTPSNLESNSGEM